jgi:hypothetical protein
MPTFRRSHLAACIATALLAACGGGGGSSDSNTPVVKTGRYLDGAVQGLTYETPTQSGATDANGAFTYLDGETVTFKLYGAALSSSVAYSTLTPGDMGSGTDLDAIVNQLRFLQTIDADNDLSNGIAVPQITGAFTANFKQRIEAFEADAAVQQFLIDHAAGRPLVSVQSAVEHFSASLATAQGSADVLNLEGKTARSVITRSDCTNADAPAAQGWFEYTFGATSGTFQGADTFNYSNGVCTVGARGGTETFIYADMISDEFLSCAPGCSYAEINRLRHGLDVDGRTVVELSWHTPGTKRIDHIKRIVIDPNAPNNPAALATFKETITLNN